MAKNKRFDITVRFEDEFGNLTNYAPEGTLVDLSYEHLRENLNWKLFVPETGFVILPNLYFNEAGIYRIRLRNQKTNEIFISLLSSVSKKMTVIFSGDCCMENLKESIRPKISRVACGTSVMIKL